MSIGHFLVTEEKVVRGKASTRMEVAEVAWQPFLAWLRSMGGAKGMDKHGGVYS